MTEFAELLKVAENEVTAAMLKELVADLAYTGDMEQLLKGVSEEQEHGPDGPEEGKYDITDGDLEDTANIAASHISEIPDYYDRLEDMEEEAEEDFPEVNEEDVEEQADEKLAGMLGDIDVSPYAEILGAGAGAAMGPSMLSAIADSGATQSVSSTLGEEIGDVLGKAKGSKILGKSILSPSSDYLENMLMELSEYLGRRRGKNAGQVIGRTLSDELKSPLLGRGVGALAGLGLGAGISSLLD